MGSRRSARGPSKSIGARCKEANNEEEGALQPFFDARRSVHGSVPVFDAEAQFKDFKQMHAEHPELFATVSEALSSSGHTELDPLAARDHGTGIRLSTTGTSSSTGTMTSTGKSSLKSGSANTGTGSTTVSSTSTGATAVKVIGSEYGHCGKGKTTQTRTRTPTSPKAASAVEAPTRTHTGPQQRPDASVMASATAKGAIADLQAVHSTLVSSLRRSAYVECMPMRNEGVIAALLNMTPSELSNGADTLYAAAEHHRHGASAAEHPHPAAGAAEESTRKNLSGPPHGQCVQHPHTPLLPPIPIPSPFLSGPHAPQNQVLRALIEAGAELSGTDNENDYICRCCGRALCI